MSMIDYFQSSNGSYKGIYQWPQIGYKPIQGPPLIYNSNPTPFEESNGFRTTPSQNRFVSHTELEIPRSVSVPKPSDSFLQTLQHLHASNNKRISLVTDSFSDDDCLPIADLQSRINRLSYDMSEQMKNINSLCEKYQYMLVVKYSLGGRSFETQLFELINWRICMEFSSPNATVQPLLQMVNDLLPKYSRYLLNANELKKLIEEYERNTTPKGLYPINWTLKSLNSSLHIINEHFVSRLESIRAIITEMTRTFYGF